MTRIRTSLMLPVVALSLALGSCRHDDPAAPSVERATSRQALHDKAPTPTVVYGPATFTRDTGKPRTDTAVFSARAGDTLTFEFTPFAEREQEHQRGNDRDHAGEGLNATVEVNGRELYSSTERREPAEKVRIVARASNTLRVRLAGKAGSSLRIVATVPASPAPVETRVLSVVYEGSVVGAIASGDTALALGSRVRYGFAPHAGFRRLRVVVDGRLAPESGTLTMDRAHWIAASADTVITLDATEQPLAQRLRALLNSATPRDDWRAYQATAGKAAAAWGAEAGVHLARIETVTIDPVTDLAKLVRLDSALAGMVTTVELPAVASGLRDGTAQGATGLPTSARTALALEFASTREATHILVVNGILTSEAALGVSAEKLARRLAEDPIRFPRATTTLSHLYNPSFFNLSELGRVITACTFNLFGQAAARHLTYTQALSSAPYYLTCLAALGFASFHENDFSEMLRWAGAASSHDRQVATEADNLARLVRSFQNDARRHVLVVAHSEGSLLTQLGVQRMKDVYGHDEGSAPRCLGTVSVAGVGTANWPLSDRHSRFVVAKHDLVTLLPGDLRNGRPTRSDADVRSYEAALVGIALSLPTSAVGLAAAMVLGPIEIHAFDRYIASSEIWPVISNGLDELYRTCAVGAVTVAPTAATLQPAGAASLNASWTAVDGQPLTTADSVVWSVDSDLAAVTQGGRVVAGSTPGIVAVHAKVRNTVGTAYITIVPDSAQAPPVVTVAERTFTDYQIPGPMPGPPMPLCGAVRAMTISATAMPGASIRSVVLYNRSIAAPYVYESGTVPLDIEFVYAQRDCVMPWGPVLDTHDFSWYRLVVTDSRGTVTEKLGPNP